MTFRYLPPPRLLPNLAMVIEASGLSNVQIARALTERGRSTYATTVMRWRRQSNAPTDLRVLAEWSGISERDLHYGTESRMRLAIAQAKAKGGMPAPSPDAPRVPPRTRKQEGEPDPDPEAPGEDAAAPADTTG